MPAKTIVLYVEDNDANFTLVQRLLQATQKIDVCRARSCEDARHFLNAQTPALILLDHELPGMLGIDYAKELKSTPATAAIPLVLITASVMKREREEALAAGVDKFMEKPFDIVALRNLVEQMTGLA